MADQATGVAFPLYQRVATERARQGWTWTRLTARAGVARSTINSWAHIATPPQPEKVNAVADLLGIPRLEALRLAGILKDEPPAAPDDELIPQCIVEREVIGESIATEMKRDFVRKHRARGHTEACQPFQRPASSAKAGPLAELAV